MNLQTFCYWESETRWDLTHPFVWNGFEHASDGRVIVRVAAPGRLNQRIRDETVAGLKLFAWDHAAVPADEWLALPTDVETLRIQMLTCHHCGGNGKQLGMLSDPCDECDGSGQIVDQASLGLMLGCSLLGKDYLIKIGQEIPGALIERGTDPCAPRRFKSPDGSVLGYLMPRRPVT